MFKDLHILLKFTLLFIFYAIIAVGEYALYHYSLSVENHWLEILLSFIQCWWLILVGFLFFQTFKYFRLPEFVYRKKVFETELYFKLLGLDLFRYMLVNSFFRRLNPRVYLKGRGKEYIKVFTEETKQSETSHLFSGVVTLVPQIGFLLNQELFLFWSLTLWTVLFNLYPMFLQRKNRFNTKQRYPELFGKDDSESGS